MQKNTLGAVTTDFHGCFLKLNYVHSGCCNIPNAEFHGVSHGGGGSRSVATFTWRCVAHVHDEFHRG